MNMREQRWRIARISVGVALIGLGAATVLPRMIHPVSSEAMLNAELVTVRTPVEGRLEGTDISIGDRVAAGQVIGRVRSFRPDSGRRDQTALDLAAQRRLALALAEEVEGLQDFERLLSRESEDYRRATLDKLAFAETEAKAKLRAAEAAHQHAQSQVAVRIGLLDKNIVAPPYVEAAEAVEHASRAALDATQAEAQRASAEHEAARCGTYLGDGANNVPYSRQRLDEVRLKLLARRSDVANAEARTSELAAQLTTEETELARLSEAAVTVPTDGVVWQRLAAEGEGLRGGDPVIGIVDCRALFLTAVLPKRFFSALKAGDRASARLLGEGEALPAIVQSVQAAGGGHANSSAAVTPVAEEGKDVVVTLSVRTETVGHRSDNLCQVGQRATVTFNMPALSPIVDAISEAAAGVARGFSGRG
jgi:multidrug resistance efflux pump